MNYQDFTKALNDARTFQSDNDTRGVAFDAIVTMCYVTNMLSSAQGSSSAVHCRDDDKPNSGQMTGSAVPKWFTDALLLHCGKKVTSSAILASIGRPTDINSTRAAGVWLRAIAGEPRRSNGQTVFTIPGPSLTQQQAASPMENDPDDPENPEIPLASRVLSYIARTDGDLHAEQVTLALRMPNTKPNVHAVWEVLKGQMNHVCGNVFTRRPR